MNYDLKYKIACDLIDKGYIIHASNNVFDYFEPTFIKGWPRAKEGYGFYFTDMPYKPIEYGENWKIVKKDEFNFLKSNSLINEYTFNDSIIEKIYKLEDSLNYVRSNREYDEIQNEIEKLYNLYDEFGGKEFFNVIKYTISTYNVKTFGSLEYNIPNPQKWVPKLTKFYVKILGYDGYETQGIYTIFNFNKLNSLVETIDLNNYNLNESLDISSFEIHNKLNPNFWKNDKLDSRIRLKLLDIADDFTDFLNVNWIKPKDIIMTGSLANYNWSIEHSDIDLHIVFDFKEVDKRIDFVKNYFDSKKKIWNQEHKNIKIFGFPVELYVQDINETHASSGIYSIEENKWIKKPEKQKLNQKTLKIAEKNAENWAEKIDDLLNKYNINSIESKKEEVLDDIDKTINNVKDVRKKGLSNGNIEMNQKNLMFKILRRNGYIDKMYNKKNEIYDDLMSID